MQTTNSTKVKRLNVWWSWAEQKGHGQKIENHEEEALKKILEDFYATMRKKDGQDYEPDSLRIMVTSIDCYLKEQGYKHSIIRDRQFNSSKQVIKGKARPLRQQGKGKWPNSLVRAPDSIFWSSRSSRALQHDRWRLPFRLGRKQNGVRWINGGSD